MDFARKQLEKYGWKDGEGLGKAGNEGISAPIKPKLKTGKEGMGFDLAKNLTDPWWTNVYNESLSRVKVQIQESLKKKKKAKADVEPDAEVIVSVSTENESEDGPPSSKIRKRMLKSNFPDFEKGATLTNGLMEEEVQNQEDNDNAKSSKTLLTDEELLKACEGRTCHKAARFGSKLSGKLARIAAQDEELRRKKIEAVVP